METALETAIKNQLPSRFNPILPMYAQCGLCSRFNGMSADKGIGAVMMMIRNCPSLSRKAIVETLHRKYNTTGEYASTFTVLHKAKLIARVKRGYVLTELGENLLKEKGLI